jgi:photosystem II stability/assembly factor-like uncharacterized protein
MKKILLTFISALTFCGAHSQWINQNLPPITYDSYMYDVEVVDANNVWAAQQDGSTGATTQYTKNFVRTTDGGNTWTHGSVTGSPAANVICNIWPTSATDAYVSMFGAGPVLGGVWKTTDGGTTWNEVGTNMFISATSFPDVVYFWDAQNGMAMGDPIGSPLKYEIWLTNDAGATWTAVPPANIPALTNPGEYGITNLFSAAGGYVWFGTTYGDVYRSVDGGNNWTKSATGLPPYNTGTQEQDISDIAFSDQQHGLVTQLNGTGLLIKQTSDGGDTWADVIPAGLVYASDIDAIPGTTTGVFVSGGSSTFGFGSSFSIDNGLTWTDLDVNISHTGMDFLDASTGWGGEFIAANSSAGGAWKFTGIPIPVACGSSAVSPGTTIINPNLICWLDTLVVNTTGVVAPTDGTIHGFSLLVSNVDISGNNDVNNLITTGVVIGGTGVIIGSTIPTTSLTNDGTIFPTGIYYFTPVVYGNATGPVNPNVTQLTFDINCTNTGTSVMVNLLANGDPLCTTGIEENSANSFGIKNIYPVPAKDNVNVLLNAKESGMVTVSVKDLMGREVFSNQFSTVKGENNLTLDLSKQSAGVYVLTVTGNESTAVSKFVKD